MVAAGQPIVLGRKNDQPCGYCHHRKGFGAFYPTIAGSVMPVSAARPDRVLS